MRPAEMGVLVSGGECEMNLLTNVGIIFAKNSKIKMPDMG